MLWYLAIYRYYIWQTKRAYARAAASCSLYLALLCCSAAHMYGWRRHIANRRKQCLLPRVAFMTRSGIGVSNNRITCCHYRVLALITKSIGRKRRRAWRNAGVTQAGRRGSYLVVYSSGAGRIPMCKHRRIGKRQQNAAWRQLA